MKRTLRWVVTILLIGVILWQLGDPREVGRLMMGIDPVYIFLSALVITADRALMTYKWALLLRGRGVCLPFLEGFKIYSACQIWGMFLPSTLGADAVRAFSVSRLGLETNQVVASILIERMIGFVSAIILGLISLVLLSLLVNIGPWLEFIWWVGGATLVVVTVLFAASFSRWGFNLLHDRLLHKFHENRIVQRVRQFHLKYLEYQDDKARLIVFFILTFIEQLSPILNIWLIGRGIGVEVNLLSAASVIPLSLLISRIPVSIDGLGVLDGVFMFLMSAVGVQPPQSIAMILAGRIMQVVSMLPWWVIQVVGWGSIRPPQPAIAEGRPDFIEKPGSV